MCNKTTTYIQKTVEDIDVEFKSQVNQHISECRYAISSGKFRKYAFHCGNKIDGNLLLPFFDGNIMMSLKDCQK